MKTRMKVEVKKIMLFHQQFIAFSFSKLFFVNLYFFILIKIFVRFTSLFCFSVCCHRLWAQSLITDAINKIE